MHNGPEGARRLGNCPVRPTILVLNLLADGNRRGVDVEYIQLQLLHPTGVYAYYQDQALGQGYTNLLHCLTNPLPTQPFEVVRNDKWVLLYVVL